MYRHCSKPKGSGVDRRCPTIFDSNGTSLLTTTHNPNLLSPDTNHTRIRSTRSVVNVSGSYFSQKSAIRSKSCGMSAHASGFSLSILTMLCTQSPYLNKQIFNSIPDGVLDPKVKSTPVVFLTAAIPKLVGKVVVNNRYVALASAFVKIHEMVQTLLMSND